MHETGYRKHGGIGFSINDPITRLSFHRQKNFKICDKREHPLTNIESTTLLELLNRIRSRYSLKFAAKIVIRGKSRHHIGLGMGTAIRLGILEGLFKCNNRTIKDTDLIGISERGGTSGIGIHTYFSGGLVFDLGIPNDGSSFQPSSRPGRKILPLKLPALKLPEWSMCICFPNDLETLTQQEEIEFFQNTAPIAEEKAFESCYHALFGVYSSIAERDYDLFCKSVQNLQNAEWKRKEWLLYGSRLFDLRSSLLKDGVSCVGMSSLGPLIYCFGNEICLKEVQQKSEIYNCIISIVKFCNSGRLIKDH